jgi:hypothetical protein
VANEALGHLLPGQRLARRRTDADVRVGVLVERVRASDGKGAAAGRMTVWFWAPGGGGAHGAGLEQGPDLASALASRSS